MFVLPYEGIQREHTLKYIKRATNKVLPENRNMQLVYSRTKLGTKFNVKDNTKKERHHDHSVKSVRIRSYSGPYFPVSAHRISSFSVRMWKNTDQNNSDYGHILRSGFNL